MAGRINGAVVQVILTGLREALGRKVQGDDALLEAARGQLGVSLDSYREFLRQVRADQGGRVILQAGRALESLVDPLLFVLLNSQDFQVLIEKEARLARFIHSRHLVRLSTHGDCFMSCEHTSRVSEPAWPEESLASAGQHISLLEQLGYAGLRLRFPESASPKLWVQSFHPTRRPMPGLDQVLLAGEARPELGEKPEIVIEVEGVLVSDLGRSR